MLVAYLRGLLLPDYPNGIRSVIRESFILESINRELGAAELIDRVKLESSYAALIKPNFANKLLKQQDKMLSLAHEKYNHTINKTNEFENLNVSSLDEFINTYKKLESQGLLKPTV
jgi:hypothetical protein